MMKVAFNNNYLRIMDQFKRLGVDPRASKDKKLMMIFDSAVKRDALRTMKNFKEGIKKNELGLHKLKNGTIERKTKLGYSHPEIPLYGKGDESKRNSYMNMLRIRENKKGGYSVYASREPHWSKKINLDKLWDIHEHGVIITKGGLKINRGQLEKKKGKEKRQMIRIPPRPALRKAFTMAMRERETKKTADIIKSALVISIMTGNYSPIRKGSEYFLKNLEQYAVTER